MKLAEVVYLFPVENKIPDKSISLLSYEPANFHKQIEKWL